MIRRIPDKRFTSNLSKDRRVSEEEETSMLPEVLKFLREGGIPDTAFSTYQTEGIYDVQSIHFRSVTMSELDKIISQFKVK